MTDYFTADLHIGHDKVAELRGYDNARHHDLTIMTSLMATVKPGDNLWILGDLTNGLRNHEIATLHRLSRSLPDVKLHLVAGNHDSIHPMSSKAHRQHTAWSKVFTSIQATGTLKINGQRAILCHFPYAGDHTEEERHEQWRPRDLGAPIIHGHTHASTPVSHSPASTLQICVSLDAWGHKPVSKETLTELMKEHQ